MKLMLMILFIVAVQGLSGNILTAQSEQRPLKVGDRVPDYTFVNLINYPTKTAKVSDFKGKLLILDFWSTGCASCVQSWPKLEKLQKEFDGKIQILLVNAWQDEAIVKSLIEKRRKAGIVNLTIPSVCKDSSILKLFSIDGVPHIEWIDQNGIVSSITDGSLLNSKNIQALLNNENVAMHQKRTRDRMNTDARKSLFMVNDTIGNGERLLSHSILSEYIEGQPTVSGLYADKKNGYYGVSSFQALDGLYAFAYSNRSDEHGLYALMLNRVIIQAKDPSKYLYLIDNETQWQNLFTYQLVLNRPATPTELQGMMQADLNRYFGMNVQWEKRNLKCLVLSASDTTRIQYKTGDQDIFTSDIRLKVNGVTVAYMIKWIENVTSYHDSPYPIIDETGFKGLIGGIEVDGFNFNNYKELDRVLQKYKMHFLLQEREVDVLVISEPPGYKFPFD